MSVFNIGEHDEMLADYLEDSDQEHEMGTVFEIGEEFPDEHGDMVAEIGARFRPRFFGGRRRRFNFRRGKARVPANLARRMRQAATRKGGRSMPRLPGAPSVNDRWVALGLEDITLDNSGGGAGTTALLSSTKDVEPQLNFTPTRLVVAASNAAGVDVSHNVRITSIKIGGSEQLTAGGAGIPAVLYKFSYQGPNAGVLQRANTGVKIFVTASANVPGTEIYTVSCGFVGKG